MVIQVDMAHCLNNLFTELRDTRATLLAKLDESVRDLTVKLLACEDMVTSQSAHLDKVEQWLFNSPLYRLRLLLSVLLLRLFQLVAVFAFCR